MKKGITPVFGFFGALSSVALLWYSLQHHVWSLCPLLWCITIYLTSSVLLHIQRPGFQYSKKKERKKEKSPSDCFEIHHICPWDTFSYVELLDQRCGPFWTLFILRVKISFRKNVVSPLPPPVCESNHFPPQRSPTRVWERPFPSPALSFFLIIANLISKAKKSPSLLF